MSWPRYIIHAPIPSPLPASTQDPTTQPPNQRWSHPRYQYSIFYSTDIDSFSRHKPLSNDEQTSDSQRMRRPSEAKGRSPKQSKTPRRPSQQVGLVRSSEGMPEWNVSLAKHLLFPSDSCICCLRRTRPGAPEDCSRALVDRCLDAFSPHRIENFYGNNELLNDDNPVAKLGRMSAPPITSFRWHQRALDQRGAPGMRKQNKKRGWDGWNYGAATGSQV